MRTVVVAALLALTACQKSPAPAPVPQTAPAATAPAPAPRARVQGWESDPASYLLLGSIVPNFRATRTGGGAELTRENLRGRWTILGVFDQPRSDEESRYVSALSTAADQDPDLEVMWIYTQLAPPSGKDAERPAALIGGKELAAALSIEHSPAYLLIGPDLTIEAYRGALSATPEDGIKPVMRGVAEIKKQIAAPE